MSATPRMRSAFPATPHTSRTQSHGAATPTPAFRGGRSTTQSLAKPIVSSTSNPVIPESWIEIPQQRFYALAIWGSLTALKLWDWCLLGDTEEQGLWLFMKWVSIDAVYLFGLPSMRIPWLEWDSSTMLLLFFGHVIFDFVSMFRLSAPWSLVFALVGKSLWGAYELAINENSVSIQSVLHNDSLILGRQIIHILPEGSAILNPDKLSFCLDASITEARVPITINSTSPISIDLLRIDLDTRANETIHFTKSQIKAMHKDASRMITYSENFYEPKTLYFSIKKPGLYSLAKVVDETNLEVSRKHMAHTVIVSCPRVTVQNPDKDKCRGELSSINLEVIGTPPLRVKYTRLINQDLQESVLDSIQPDDFFSPLLKQDQTALVLPNRVDTEWARSQKSQRPINEHLGTPGTWAFTINEVRDGLGNVVQYSSKDQNQQERSRKAPHLHTVLQVHERPVISLEQSAPLKVAAGKSAILPIKLGSTGRGSIQESPYQIEYRFTPADQLTQSGEHGSNVVRNKVTLRPGTPNPFITEAGLYSLSSVGTEFCSGEVIEPAGILLENPPRPDLTLTSQEIFDKCAGRPVGLRVDLELTGTPPFVVSYTVQTRGARHLETVTEHVKSHRHQILLTPSHAAHYIYRFTEVDDAVYKGHSVRHKELQLEQDVKPSAGASFQRNLLPKVSCIEDSVEVEVGLKGEGPFKLEYELLHGGKRQKFELKDVSGSLHRFSTPPLREGGEYTISLKSIVDGTGCKEFLSDERKLNVKHQKPKVAFGKIDGEAQINLLEGKKAQLPLRLSGDAPWNVKYRDAAGREHTHRADNANSRIIADSEGTYQLLDVSDAICPGLVDQQADTFAVGFVPRPQMRLLNSETMERKGNAYVQQAVCEGEEAAFELIFKGAAPFSVHYTEHMKPLQGVKAPANKELQGLQSVATFRLDTLQAGTYDYKFTKLEDANYEHDSRHFSNIAVQHQVYARPSAEFANAGKTYSFCSVQTEGEEVVPVNLHGQAPFDLEIEISYHGSGKPEIISLTGITTNHHSIRIPHKSLHLGKSTIALRRISDSRGCSRIIDSSVPRVQIAVFEPPSIFALEHATDFCVGDHINFGLSGQPPYTISYKFEGHEKKAVVHGTQFKRLAEKPGTFTITGVQDSASSCRANVQIVKQIHGLPSARVSRGRESYIDIHEGGTAEILFEFGGVPPFEFTYQRSANTEKGRRAGVVLDTHSEVSDDYSLSIRASEEGTYEVTSIKDRFCSYSKATGRGKSEQKRLTY